MIKILLLSFHISIFLPYKKKGNEEEVIFFNFYLFHFGCMILSMFSIQFSSVAQPCPTLCDPMNCSTPGLPVHHQLPEFTQTTSIESVMPSSHLILCRPLLLLPPIPPSIRVFSNPSVNSSHEVAKVLEFQFSIIP